MKLTKALIDVCRSDRGAFTTAAAINLGAKIPLEAGWPERLVGTEVSDAAYNAARTNRNPRAPGTRHLPGQLGFEL